MDSNRERERQGHAYTCKYLVELLVVQGQVSSIGEFLIVVRTFEPQIGPVKHRPVSPRKPLPTCVRVCVRARVLVWPYHTTLPQ